MRVVFAVAAYGEVGGSGPRRQEREEPGMVAPGHLGPILAHERLPPFGVVVAASPSLSSFRTRRELRKPDVVPVSGRMMFLRNAARRPPNGPNAQTLAGSAIGAEADDADGHEG